MTKTDYLTEVYCMLQRSNHVPIQLCEVQYIKRDEALVSN